jgi:hypothetical protein
VHAAAEVDRDGLLLGDMQASLLRKVEALTRYSLEHESRIANLQLWVLHAFEVTQKAMKCMFLSPKPPLVGLR